MPADPFSAEQRPAVRAALEAIQGTEGDEQVIIATVGGTLDVAHLDDEFAVYLEWDGGAPFDQLGLTVPPDGEIHDAGSGNATVSFGALDAAGVVDLLASWAAQVFTDRPMEWSATLDE